MSQIERLNPTCLFNSIPFGFSQIVKAPAKARLVFIAGQLGEKSNGEPANDFETQVQWSFENLRLALQQANSSPQSVLKITILVVNLNQERLSYISASRREFFGEHKPASTIIPVPRVAGDGMEFEIDAIAIES
ncbi:MAG: RidA family protein [Symploca sp. SIO3C6]|nr:RidA family protein [Symploca sp. SIO3C6]